MAMKAENMRAGLSVSLFENYAVLQRPVQPLLKALERVDWASFGLTTQARCLLHLLACAHSPWPQQGKAVHSMRLLD